MKNAAQSGGILFKNKLLILVLALLVGDAAAGLAGGLAGGLALAAAAVLGALAQGTGLKGRDSFHCDVSQLEIWVPAVSVQLLPDIDRMIVQSVAQNADKVKVLRLCR